MSDEPEYYEEREPEPDPDDARRGAKTPRGKKLEAERKQQEILQRRADVARAMLSQPSGREFLAWLLLEVCAFNQSTEHPLFADAPAHFRAGQRDVALKLHRLLLETDRSGYMVLLSEFMD